MLHEVVVKSGSNSVYLFEKKLKNFGLSRSARNRFNGTVEEKDIKKIYRYAKMHHLIFYIDNEYGKRSSTYREEFFAHHKPVFSNLYLCPYCGFLVSEKRLVVDHLYPIGKTARDLSLQRKLKRMGIDNINSYKNLVPSHKFCNSSKGQKMGLWTIRGKLGRHLWFWFFIWSLRIAVLIFAIIQFVIYSENIRQAFLWFFSVFT